MRILVFVKDVPAGPDPAPYSPDLTLDRSGSESAMSGVDPFAVAEAVRLRARYGGEVVVATMGPDAAAGTLRDALALGADAALLLSDPRLAGADADAAITSRALESMVRAVSPDLVLLGRESGDGRLGVMAGMLAERLGWPAMSAVDRLETVGAPGGAVGLVARQRTEHGTATLRSTLPLVASAAEYAAELPPVRVEDLRRAYRTGVRRLTVEELGLEGELAAPAEASAAGASAAGPGPEPSRERALPGGRMSVRSVRETPVPRRRERVAPHDFEASVTAILRELEAAGLRVRPTAAVR
jgi:electron transfer flavoprotein beta subunit